MLSQERLKARALQRHAESAQHGAPKGGKRVSWE
jgi:hypothetical protein